MDIARAKPRRIVVMSNISGIYPLLHDFSPARKETSFRLHVNLSNVRKVDSIGLSILFGLLFLGKKRPEDYVVNLTWSMSDNVNKALHNLGLLELIDTLSLGNVRNGYTVDLFDDLIDHPDSRKSADNGTFDSDGLQEVILFTPKSHTNRQEALNSFSLSLKKFMARDRPRTFNHEQIIKVFIELAKNTYDHSCGIGIAGLHVFTDTLHAKKIQFVYCDTGEGICSNVRNYLAKSDLSEESSFFKQLTGKGSAIDFLHKAFQAGFSTKRGNGVNHGMGLTLITQGAAGCGFNVLLRDADSIIDLSGIEEPYSHTKLRANSSRTTAPKLLMLYIEREM
jgi:ABC-type transporter Mla MlaB component